jgi:hypothetical protein
MYRAYSNTNEEEKAVAESRIRRLEEKGYSIVTRLRPASIFFSF